MAHGSCNFAPPKDLKHDNDLLERKRRDREQQAADDSDDIRKKVDYILTLWDSKYMSGNACIDQNSMKKYQ